MKKKVRPAKTQTLVPTWAVIVAATVIGIAFYAFVRMEWPQNEGASTFYSRLHTAMGLNLARYSTLDGAIQEFEHALRLDPAYADAANHLANTLLQHGRSDEAIQTYRRTLAIAPEHPDANNNLGLAMLLSGQFDKAVHHFQTALKVRPESPDVRSNMGVALMHQNKLTEAEHELRKAIELNAGINASHNLALCLYRQGKLEESVRFYDKTLELNPNHFDSLTELSWLLSTASQDHLRNGQRALQLAQQAASVSQGPPSRVLRSLAAALAETGDFNAATSTAEQAHQLALTSNESMYASSLQSQIQAYRSRKAWREPATDQ